MYKMMNQSKDFHSNRELQHMKEYSQAICDDLFYSQNPNRRILKGEKNDLSLHWKFYDDEC